jgi:hypothetical protein
MCSCSVILLGEIKYYISPVLSHCESTETKPHHGKISTEFWWGVATSRAKEKEEER